METILYNKRKLCLGRLCKQASSYNLMPLKNVFQTGSKPLYDPNKTLDRLQVLLLIAKECVRLLNYLEIEIVMTSYGSHCVGS